MKGSNVFFRIFRSYLNKYNLEIIRKNQKNKNLLGKIIHTLFAHLLHADLFQWLYIIPDNL